MYGHGFTGELLRSTPLPEVAQRVVLERLNDFVGELSTNQHLHPEVWKALYAKKTPADHASALASSITSPDQVDHMVVAAQERRAGPLGLVMYSWVLGHEAQRAAVSRRLPAALATRFAQAPWALPEVRSRAAQWVGGDERIELLAALLPDDLSDDVVWDLHLSTLSKWKEAPTEASVPALVQVLRARPALRGRVTGAGEPFLLAAASQLPLSRDEQEAAVLALGRAAEEGPLGPLWQRVLLALLDRLDVAPEVRRQAVEAMRRSGSEQLVLEAQAPRSRTPFPQGVGYAELSVEQVDQVLYRTPVTTFEARAVSWAELATNPNLLPDQLEVVGSHLLRDEVRSAVGLLPPERDVVAGRLPAGDPTRRALEVLRSEEEEEVRERRREAASSASTRRNPNGYNYQPYRPEPPSASQVRGAGGVTVPECMKHSWGAGAQAAYRHLAAALGGDADAWEVALRLGENFTGTVAELAEAAKLTTTR